MAELQVDDRIARPPSGEQRVDRVGAGRDAHLIIAPLERSLPRAYKGLVVLDDQQPPFPVHHGSPSGAVLAASGSRMRTRATPTSRWVTLATPPRLDRQSTRLNP